MHRNPATPALAVRAKTGWRLLGIAACAVLLLSSAVPTLVNAEELVDASTQFYRDLEAQLSSLTEEDIGTPVLLSPKDLGFSPEGEIDPSAPASFSSFSLQSAGSQTPTYDFAIDAVSLNGNIPTVPGCDRNPFGVARSFFDNFDDGQVDMGCTSHFFKQGIFRESGGFLRMRSEDGISAGGIIAHNLTYDTRFRDGAGERNFTAAVAFRPDTPQAPPLFSSYGFFLIDDVANPSALPALNIHVLKAEGKTFVVAGTNFGPGMIFRFNPIDLSGKPSILLGASFNDTTNLLTAFYSFDSGQTFFGFRNPDGSPFRIPLFTNSPEAKFIVAGSVREEPEPEPERTPVVVVPGLLGSWWKRLTPTFSASELDFEPFRGTYDNLLNSFRSNGYIDARTLFKFPYDWRLDNRLNAAALRDKIAEIKNICQCPKVDVVAHSMGGLVARYYVQTNLYQGDIDHLILLGTPNRGAPKSYLAWEGGALTPTIFADSEDYRTERLLRVLAKSEGFGFDLFNYIRNKPLPSVQQLLPTYDYLRSATSTTLLFYPDGYPENIFLGENDADLGLNAPALLSRLGQSGVAITNIVGNNGQNDTIGTIRIVNDPSKLPLWEHGYPENFDALFGDHGLERGAGDRTVSIESASALSLPNVKQVGISSSHIELPSDAFPTIFKELTGQEPTFTSQQPLIKRLLIVPVFSPADIQLVDPSGRRVGKDFVTGQDLAEIPGAYYTGTDHPELEFVAIPEPSDGAYQLITRGTDAGSYRVETSFLSDATSTTASFEGNTAPGVVASLNFNFSSSNLAATTITPADTTPPTTRPTITRGRQGKNGWGISEQEITLTAEDNPGGVGVFKTEYSLDNGTTWRRYEGPFLVKDDGAHLVAFRSEDYVGNEEQTRFTFVRIDQTPPEAQLSFDPVSFSLKVEGTDNLSQPTVTQDGFTYTIEDSAGHTAVLAFGDLKQAGKRLKAELKSIQYDDQQPVILNADLHAEWSLEKDDTIKELEQKLQARHFKMEAKYQGKKDETRVKARIGNVEKAEETLPYLRIAKLITEQGALSYGILAPFSAEFNGKDAFLSRPSTPSLTLTTDFTLEAWVKITEAPAPGESYLLLAKHQPPTQRSYLWFYRTLADGVKQLLFCTSPDGVAIACRGLSSAFTPAADLGENRWHHLAVRFFADPERINQVETLIDGANLALAGSGLQLPKINQSIFTLGAGQTLDGVLFFPAKVLLDEVRVWNVALADDQIASGRFGELAGNESGLVGYWRFTKDFLDSSASRNDLTNHNVVFSLDSPPLSGFPTNASPGIPSQSMFRTLLANTLNALSWIMQSVYGLWR